MTSKINKNKILQEPFYNNEIVKKAYKEDNFLIQKTNARSNRAIIFFSGNGLYYPNTINVFEEKIVTNNYYEWINISKSEQIQNYYGLIIFVRDLNKCWYAKGINNAINTIEKVVEKLRQLSRGYEITTCGNSAGAYMAMYSGNKLNAKRIFNFSGQYKLEESDYERVLNYYNIPVKDISEWFNSNTNNLFYFWPYYSEQDKNQYNLIKKYKIKNFKFDENIHGQTVEGICYPYLLTMSNKKLIKLSDKFDSIIINKTNFTKHVVPIYKYLFKIILSITNSSDRKHKVLTILGIKIKFKKQKN